VATSGVHLNEVLAAVSLATDLGLGQPSEHMVRAARLSMRLGKRLGLDADQLAVLYDVSLLTYVGCPVYGNEAAMVFGDDIDFRSGTYDVDLGAGGGKRYMLSRAGSGRSGLSRFQQAARLMATGGRSVAEQMANHCSAAGLLADQLGLDPGVRVGVVESYARWDGKGVPRGLHGEQLSLASRISHVADAAEVLERRLGLDDAAEVIGSRSGTHFDPMITEALETDTRSLFDGIATDSIDELLELEPIERPALDEKELDEALATVGDFCDLRAPCFAGHARGTAELCAGAARLLQLPPEEARVLRRAAHVHDIGRFGVPGSVLIKPGPLTGTDLERMRMHVYWVERIFSRPDPLKRVGLVASMHHERMDGSGYHRAAAGSVITNPCRILAVADAYHAMLQDRPYRRALSPQDAAREIRTDTAAGRLDPVAAEAVLEAAGHGHASTRSGGPAGLTARECEILALLASGLPNKGIARRLAISPKTVGNHVEHIYTKLGVTNRAGAALLAMRHGIVDVNEASRAQS
jgi:HD-GYP domain-containing protein (c-di-GMP phosphodiesterase class II)